jgi:hypothetical protein
MNKTIPSIAAPPPQIEFPADDSFPAETAAPPLECGLTVVCRAAADAETGGPAGRPAFTAPKRRPGRGGEIDTRRVLLRLRRKRARARMADVKSPASRRASRPGRRAPRRSRGTRAAFGQRERGGDGGDGSGDPDASRGDIGPVSGRRYEITATFLSREALLGSRSFVAAIDHPLFSRVMAVPEFHDDGSIVRAGDKIRLFGVANEAGELDSHRHGRRFQRQRRRSP